MLSRCTALTSITILVLCQVHYKQKKKIEVTVKKYTVELCLLCIPWGDWEGIVFLLSSVFTSLIKTVNYLLEECLTLENSSILMPGVMLTFLSQ